MADPLRIPQSHLYSFSPAITSLLLSTPPRQILLSIAPERTHLPAQSNTLVYRTLLGANMIEGMVCTREHDDYDKRKVTTFVKIGGGCNGHEATMHGGMISTLVDELMGVVNFAHRVSPSFTAYLRVDFVKPIATPCELVIDTWIETCEGRKRFSKASIATVDEEGKHTVMATANALFIEWNQDAVTEWRKTRSKL